MPGTIPHFLSKLLPFLPLLVATSTPGASTFVEFLQLDESTTRLITTEDSSSYYILEVSPDLLDYDPLAIGRGIEAPVWDIVFAPFADQRVFYRIHASSIFTPLDSDGDGIDDIYELNHPDILDPLDPDDADLDPDENGLTHLQEYLRTILDTEAPPQYYSPEVTTFNFGVAPNPVEASSRLISIYQGSGPPTVAFMPRVESREISLFNFPLPSSPVEATSRLFSVYNGDGAPTVPFIPVVVSRQVSAFNFGGATAPVDSLSREFTVFNFGQPAAAVEAISREITVNALMPQD